MEGANDEPEPAREPSDAGPGPEAQERHRRPLKSPSESVGAAPGDLAVRVLLLIVRGGLNRLPPHRKARPGLQGDPVLLREPHVWTVYPFDGAAHAPGAPGEKDPPVHAPGGAGGGLAEHGVHLSTR